jgi:germination protein M
MRFLAALSLLCFVPLAGCGGDEEAATTVRETVTETATVPDESATALTVYFLLDGKVAPVSREVVAGPRVGAAALEELFEGPTSAETALETAIPAGVNAVGLTIEGSGVASVGLSKPVNKAARAQIVYTLTQFPTVRRVEINEAPPLGRRAFEAQTPAILVESPLPGESVEPGFDVTGTANTFEATFNYELQDETGRVLSKDFVTATSGSGTRGTFSFQVPYELDEPTEGKLVVFELSAEDGSRINEHEIPLRLE